VVVSRSARISDMAHLRGDGKLIVSIGHAHRLVGCMKGTAEA